MQETTRAKIQQIKDTATTVDIIFDNEELGDEGAALLADALQGRQLSSLYLKKSGISNEGFKLLAPVINASTNLSILDLTGHDFDFSLLKMANLMTLNLTSCKITEATWKNIATLITTNPNLDSLILDGNTLTDNIIQELAKKEWDKLSLVGCNLSVKGCELLIPHAVEDVSSINIKNNGMTDEQWNDELKWAKFFAQKVQAKIDSSVKDLRETIEQQAKIIIGLESKLAYVAENQVISIKELESKLEQAAAKILTYSQMINEALFTASKNGNLKSAMRAIENGADLKAQDPETGETALSLSLINNHRDIAEMLQKQDPNVIFYPNKLGQTPLEETVIDDLKSDNSKWLWEETKKIKSDAEEKETEFKKIYELSSTGNKKYFAADKLWESVKFGHIEGIKKVLDLNEMNLDVNMFHPVNKETPLFQVVYYRHDVSLAAYLLQKNASYNTKCRIFNSENLDSSGGELKNTQEVDSLSSPFSRMSSSFFKSQVLLNSKRLAESDVSAEELKQESGQSSPTIGKK